MEDLDKHCMVLSFETINHDIYNPNFSSSQDEEMFQDLKIVE